jgi:hypothetical protein
MIFAKGAIIRDGIDALENSAIKCSNGQEFLNFCSLSSEI